MRRRTEAVLVPPPPPRGSRYLDRFPSVRQFHFGIQRKEMRLVGNKTSCITIAADYRRKRPKSSPSQEYQVDRVVRVGEDCHNELIEVVRFGDEVKPEAPFWTQRKPPMRTRHRRTCTTQHEMSRPRGHGAGMAALAEASDDSLVQMMSKSLYTGMKHVDTTILAIMCLFR